MYENLGNVEKQEEIRVANKHGEHCPFLKNDASFCKHCHFSPYTSVYSQNGETVSKDRLPVSFKTTVAEDPSIIAEFDACKNATPILAEGHQLLSLIDLNYKPRLTSLQFKLTSELYQHRELMKAMTQGEIVSRRLAEIIAQMFGSKKE